MKNEYLKNITPKPEERTSRGPSRVMLYFQKTVDLKECKSFFPVPEKGL